MKREIKFRGLSLEGEWIYGQVHVYGDGVFVCQDKLMNNDGLDWKIPAIEVDPETIGQFTGLHDCHGKEIYEGDILRLLETISTDDPAYPYYCETMEVCYSEPNCGFGLTDGGAFLKIPSNIEVIGNIYENKLLLK